MDPLPDILNLLRDRGMETSESRGELRFRKKLASRVVFLVSRKSLIYKGRIRIDSNGRRIHFHEHLVETGMGLDAGIGFKLEKTHITASGERSGSIEEQNTLFGRKYSYDFDYAALRNGIKRIAEQQGFEFLYEVV